MSDSSKFCKRTGYLSWDETFMKIALVVAQRSKDPSTQVGACLVNPDNIVLGLGYNGFPRGCSDDEFPWSREANDPYDTKYPYVVHAESNAIHNTNSRSLKGCRLYVTLFPCNNCAKQLLQEGITEIIYLEDKYPDSLEVKASRRMFQSAGVRLRQLTLA